MSFLNIKNPNERDKIVAEYLATIKRIQKREVDERTQGLSRERELINEYLPITKATEKVAQAVINELEPFKEALKPIQKKSQTWDEQSDVNALEYYATHTNGADKYYSIREENGEFILGDKQIELDGNNIIIDADQYHGTPGLWRLIMLNDPKDYTEDEFHIYETIAKQTNMILHPISKRRGQPSKTKKYQILKQFGIIGQGIILPGDIKGLTSKLHLLLAEYSAGNTTTRNEIVAILDELLRRRRISKTEYSEINTFLL